MMKVVRRYGLTFFWWWIFIVLLFGAPFFFIFWLFRHGWWGQALFIIPVILGVLSLMRTLFLWRANVLVATTHRIVDIEHRGFFEKTVSEVPYDQIENVFGKIKGFWGTIFRYGELAIQTGAGKVEIAAEKIKQPVRLQQEINDWREKYVRKYSYDFSEDVAKVIIDKLYELELPELMKVREALERRIARLKK